MAADARLSDSHSDQFFLQTIDPVIPLIVFASGAEANLADVE
jgi:hypothetical protein